MQYKPYLFKALQTLAPEKIQLQANNGITTPLVGIGLFSPAECDEILRISELVQEHEAITGDGLGNVTKSKRISKVREVYPNEKTDWIFAKLEAAMMQFNTQYRFGITGFFEGAQVYKYPVGGFLDWHMDVAQGYMSNRKLSMTIQLTDGNAYEGCDLMFMNLANPAPRGRGDVTVFPAYLMHRVTELTRGERFSWVSWVHGPPFA